MGMDVLVRSPFEESRSDRKYIVMRWSEGGREYLRRVTPTEWTGDRSAAYRFVSAREADRLTRGVGWRMILEVTE
jgi:hypothetical protein